MALKILSFFQWNPFEPEPTIPLEETFPGPSIALFVFAWIFLVIGIIALIVLILYTKYGREVSVKLSVVNIVIASSFLGFSLHFFLLHFGI